MTWPKVSPAGGPGQGPASGVPARNRGTQPPLPPGQTLSLRHGAASPRVYDPIAADLLAALLDVRPDLARYPGEVAAWARAEARVMLLDKYAVERGLLDEQGDPHPFTTRLMLPLEREAARARAALGLTPLTDAALTRERATTAHLAVDIEAILVRGREANAARDADPVASALASVREAGDAAYARAVAEHTGGSTS